MCAVLSAGAVREVTYDDSVLVYCCLPPEAAPESRAICSVSRYLLELNGFECEAVTLRFGCLERESEMAESQFWLEVASSLETHLSSHRESATHT